MKRRLGLLSMILALMLVLASCGGAGKSEDSSPAAEEGQAADALFTPGTYEGTSKGFGGDIKVSVTVTETEIAEIVIGENSETEGIGAAAMPKLVDAIIGGQTLAVDSVSGATITSEGFMKAMEDALTQAGADINALKSANADSGADKETVEMSKQVVVVGAGGSGLAAAVDAAQQGAEVLVIEKMAIAGGATAMAVGGTNSTGSEWQKEAGIEDSPELLFEDLMRNGHNKNYEPTVRHYSETVGDAFNWLVAEDGANLQYDKEDTPSPSAEHTVGRNYSAVGGGGAIVKTLLERADENGVEIIYDLAGKELIVEDGKVTGIKALATDGTPYEIKSEAVIIATGGFGANEEYLDDYVKSLAYAGAVSATGDGLEMATAIGADTVNMDLVNIQPHSIIKPDGRGQHTYQGVLKMYFGTGSILVSDKGERFINEQGSGYDIKTAMEKNEHSYLIMDAPSFEEYAKTCIESKNYTQEDLDEWLAANGTMTPVFAKADTLEDLAAIVEMPGDALKASVEKYNGFVAAGEDADFGRKVSAPMSEEGPFYLVEMNLRYYATLGGLKTNDKMQVVNTEEQPIEGLFAAGEVVGGLCGDIYTPGALFGWAMTSGKNAGDAAAAFVAA